VQNTTIPRPLLAVIVGGGVAATLDIIYAILRNAGYGMSPLQVLQSVASGWLGDAAFTSGVPGGMLAAQASGRVRVARDVRGSTDCARRPKVCAARNHSTATPRLSHR
jgi:hypothetical protein